MSWSRKAKTKRLIVPILLLILIGSLLVTASALALDVGLQYGTLTGLGTQDIRVSIMQVIRVILGFLGVLAIAIVLYAGYTWMTAAGNAEKIGTAKKILVNAVIGLVIIFTAFAVSSFIIDALIRATGAGQGGGGCTPGVCAGCNVICGSNGQSHEYDPVNCGGEVYCSEPVLNCPKPETPTPRICRVEAVRGTTPIGGQPQGAAGDYVTIEGWYFGSYLAGTSKVEFGSAQAEIVNCNGNPIWDEAANHYGRTRVQVPAIDPNNYTVVLTNRDNQTSAGSTFVIIEAAEARPGLACIVPTNGLNNQELVKAEGVRFGADPNTTPITTDGLFFYNNQPTVNYTSWTETLITAPKVPAVAVSGNVKVIDAAGQPSNQVWFTVSCQQNTDCASSCCRGFTCRVQSACYSGPGESCDGNSATPACEPTGQCQPGLICDNTNCLCRLPQAGENCDLEEQTGCQPGACADDRVCFANNIDCTCQDVPLIQYVSPLDGAAGNLITISGRYFGNQIGQVYFSDESGQPTILAQLANAVNSACTSSWTDNEIVVVVPANAKDGPIRVVRNASLNGLADQTNDSRGPIINNFVINNIVRPGLCLLSPDHGPVNTGVALEGVRFTGAGLETKVYFGAELAGGIANLSNQTRITGVSVPQLNNGSVGVRVLVGEQYSNPKNFTVESSTTPPPTYDCSSSTNSCVPQQNCGEGRWCNSQCRCETLNKCDDNNFSDNQCNPTQTNCNTGYYCYNPAQHGADPLKTPCYCYPAFGCDGNTTSLQCEPDNNLCPTGYHCDANSNCTCQTGTGLSEETTYNWSFKTTSNPGSCSQDEGICRPDDQRCSQGYKCSVVTCQCEKISESACTPNDTALSFAGQTGNYIEMADNDSLDIGTGDVSVAAWFKHSYADATDWGDYLVKKMDTNDCTTDWRRGYLLTLFRNLNNPNDGNLNKLSFSVGAGVGCGAGVYSNNTYNDNLWHSVVGVAHRSGNILNLKLYIDGVLDNQKNYTVAASVNNDNAEPLYIGRGFGEMYIQQYWKGLVDDVAIYKRVLTESEILAFAQNRSFATSHDQLQGYWRFNNNLNDETGVNNGTMIGKVDYVLGHNPCTSLIACDGNIANNVCDPNQAMCPPSYFCYDPNRHGADPTKQACYCYFALSCDNPSKLGNNQGVTILSENFNGIANIPANANPVPYAGTPFAAYVPTQLGSNLVWWGAKATGGYENTGAIYAQSDTGGSVMFKTPGLNLTANHYVVKVKIKTPSNSQSGGNSDLDYAGLVFGFQNNTNYWKFQWFRPGYPTDPDSQKFVFTHFHDNYATSSPILNDGNWHELAVEVVNSGSSATLIGFFDGVRILTTNVDSSVTGNVGLWAVDTDTYVNFDDFQIIELNQSASNLICAPDDSLCPSGYLCDVNSNCTCQVARGIPTDATYNWSFRTGINPGPCSQDPGICVPDAARCAENETCDPVTCQCKFAGYTCSKQKSSCEPDNTLCQPGQYCSDKCFCEPLIPCDSNLGNQSCDPTFEMCTLGQCSTDGSLCSRWWGTCSDSKIPCQLKGICSVSRAECMIYDPATPECGTCQLQTPLPQGCGTCESACTSGYCKGDNLVQYACYNLVPGDPGYDSTKLPCFCYPGIRCDNPSKAPYYGENTIQFAEDFNNLTVNVPPVSTQTPYVGTALEAYQNYQLGCFAGQSNCTILAPWGALKNGGLDNSGAIYIVGNNGKSAIMKNNLNISNDHYIVKAAIKTTADSHSLVNNAGLVLGYTAQNNYWLFEWIGIGYENTWPYMGDFQKFSISNNNGYILKTPDRIINDGYWHEIKAEVTNFTNSALINGYFDNRKILSYQTNSRIEGNVGIYGWDADAPVLFDNFSVDNPAALICHPDDKMCPPGYLCSGKVGCFCEPAINLPTESTYFWNFRSFYFGPQVVEMCNRDSNCDPNSITSPAPFSRVGTKKAGYNVSYVRPDDGAVPIDVMVTVRFTQKMYQPSIYQTTPRTVWLKECNEVNGDNFSGNGCIDVVLDTAEPLLVYDCNYRETNDANCLKVKPKNLLKPNHWYQIELNADKIFGQNGMKLAGNDPNSKDYRWVFKTKADSVLSRIGCCMLDPANSVLRAYDQRQGFETSLLAQDYWCVDVRPEKCDATPHYSWEAADPDPAEADGGRRAYIITNANATAAGHLVSNPPDIYDLSADDEKANAAADKDTLGDNPPYTYVTTTCNYLTETGATESVYCHAPTTIDLSSPYVIDHFPDCGAACLNAKIGATFSRSMVVSGTNDVKNHIKLYLCDDVSCDLTAAQPVATFDPSIMLDPAEKANTFTGYVSCYDYNGDGNFDYCLLPGRYYRVVINGTVESADTHRKLAGLNFDSNQDTEADSYSWTFSTQSQYGLCMPEVINVNPPDYVADYNISINYAAQPMTSPDSCNPQFGQRLNPYSFNWDWDTDLESKRFGPFCSASAFDNFLANTASGFYCDARTQWSLRDSCGNGAIEMGEECDDGNVASGDGCSDRCLNEGTATPTCGNGRLDPGEDCDPPGTYCNSDCTLPGNINYGRATCGNGVIEANEECDLPSDSTGCAANCKFSGSVRGKSLCGDGIVGLGEECDGSELVSGGNESSVGTGLLGTCSSNCLIISAFRDLYFCRNIITNQFVFSRPNPLDGDCTSDNDCVKYGIDYKCVQLSSVQGSNKEQLAVCGNGIVEAGENCDTGGWCEYTGTKNMCGSVCGAYDGRQTQCESIGRCYYESGQCKTKCDTLTNQRTQCENTPGCIYDAAGPRCYEANCCGNGVVESTAGEACDKQSGSFPANCINGEAENNCSYSSAAAQNNTVFDQYNNPVYCNSAGSYCGNKQVCKYNYDGFCSNGWAPCQSEGAACTSPGTCTNGWCVAGGNAYNTGCSPSNTPCSVTGVCLRDGCGANCTKNGSVQEVLDPTYTGAYQIVRTFDQPQMTYIQPWVYQYTPPRGPQGEGRLQIGITIPPGMFGVVNKWPDCGTACINADIGAKFNVSANPNTLLEAGNIRLYECGSDASCPISPQKEVQPITIRPGDEDGFDDILFHIDLPITYHLVDIDNDGVLEGGTLFPNMNYRVVISNRVSSAEVPVLPWWGLNFDNNPFDSINEFNSYSWTFKTSESAEMCTIGSVQVEPSPLTLPGGITQRYEARPRSAKDECDPLGQYLNAWFYNWDWVVVDLDRVAGANLISDLRDGYGNLNLEFGEDCDDGNLSGNDGCNADGFNTVVDTAKCGNGQPDLGEECEDSINGTICNTTGSICNVSQPATCPGGTCFDYCSNCYWTGTLNLSVCGNSIIEPGEECDTGNEPNNDDSDGCTDVCTLSGTVFGQGVICGDGKIGFGEQCDGRELASNNFPASNDANNCTGIYRDLATTNDLTNHQCSTYTTQDECQQINYTYPNNNHIIWCYWTGSACRVRPCLNESGRANSNNPGNNRWNQSSCGNASVEIGEECDDGGWCQDEDDQWVTCTTDNNDRCAASSSCTPYAGYCSQLGTNGPQPCNINSDCSSLGNNCVNDGCSQRCVNEGSIRHDTKKDPYQLVKTNIISSASSKVKEEVKAWYNLQPDIIGVGELTVVGQAIVPFKVIINQPPHNLGLEEKDLQCRNVAIYALFSRELKLNTLEGKCQKTYICASNPETVCTGRNANDYIIADNSKCPNTDCTLKQPCLSGRDCKEKDDTCQFSNFILEECGTGANGPPGFGSCPASHTASNNQITSLSYRPVQGICNDNNQCEYNFFGIRNILTSSSCANDQDCVGSLAFVTGLKDGFLAAWGSYHLYIRDGSGGVVAAAGDTLTPVDCNSSINTNCTSWNFSTSDDFCQCDYIGVNVENTSRGMETNADFFTCASDNCGVYTPATIDDDYAPSFVCSTGERHSEVCSKVETLSRDCPDGSGGYVACVVANTPMAGNQHFYQAMCYDLNNPQNSRIPLSPLGLTFNWLDFDPDNLIFLTDPLAGICQGSSLHCSANNQCGSGTCDLDQYNNIYLVTPGEDPATPKGKNGRSEVNVFAMQKNCNDSEQLCLSDADCPAGQSCLPMPAASQYIQVTNFICNNPWPDAARFPYQENENNGKDPDTNFEIYYCRDFGTDSFSDDLPPLYLPPVVLGKDETIKPVKEFIFPVGDSQEIEKKGKERSTTDCSAAWLDETDPSASVCKVPADWEYRFDGLSQGNYSLEIETFNSNQDLSALNYCDINGDNYLGGVGSGVSERTPCDPEKVGDCGLGINCLRGVTHVIKVFVDGIEKGIITNPASNQIQTGRLQLPDLSAGTHTIKLSWRNDWNSHTAATGPTIYDSNLAINKVVLTAVTGVSTGDAIGIRVLKNPLHLSPSTWYQSGLCGGQERVENICFGDNDCTANNLLINSGFEEEPENLASNCNTEESSSNWKNWRLQCSPGLPTNGANLVYISDAKRSGKLGARLTLNQTITGDWGAHLLNRFTDPNNYVLSAGSYTLSGWVRSAQQVSLSMHRRNDPDYATICSNANCNFSPAGGEVCSNIKTTDWQKLTCTFKLDKPTKVQVSVRLNQLREDNTPGRVDIDDLELFSGCQMNLPSRGSAEPVTVDNYQAVLDGRSVYVGATNLRVINANGTPQDSLFSNIYLASFNQNASSQTQEIFKRILDQTGQKGSWYFNTNFTNHRVCKDYGVFAGTDITCSPIGFATSSCPYDFSQTPTRLRDKAGCELNQETKGCYWSSDLQLCLSKLCLPIYCNNDFQCPNLKCSAEKQKVVRDAQRYADLRDMQIDIDDFGLKKGYYPKLSGGTYIASTTFSLWPSWSENLSQELSIALSTDPINRFVGCGEFYCDTNGNKKIDEGEISAANSCNEGDALACNSRPAKCLAGNPDQLLTCWQEVNKQFLCPVKMYSYAYRSLQDGTYYGLYTNFEYTGPGNWRDRPQQYCDDDNNGIIDLNSETRLCSPTQPCGGTVQCIDGPLYEIPYSCEKMNFEIHQATVAGGVTPPDCNDYQRCYGGQNQGEDCGSGNITLCPDHASVGVYCSGDADFDSICDYESSSLSNDNCNPAVDCLDNISDCYNPDQKDSNSNNQGDVCDVTCSGDADSDGVCDSDDNCINVYNPLQIDSDSDGYGNTCDPCTDVDHDGWWDVDTGANDPAICPKDNCPAGYCSDNNTPAFGCIVDSQCTGSVGAHCVINNQFIASDHFGYCTDQTGNPIPGSPCCLATGTYSGTTCSTVKACSDSDCRGLDFGMYNPYQEDYDNDLVGYICDNCVDFDKDGYGDYSFFTKSPNPVSAAMLTGGQKQHFQGCHGQNDVFGGFTNIQTPIYDINGDGLLNYRDIYDFEKWVNAGRPCTADNLPDLPELSRSTAQCTVLNAFCNPVADCVQNYKDTVNVITTNIAIENDLDNCPGGPYGAVCRDQFSVQISCINPAVTWTDVDNFSHINSQADFNLNNVGDICDLFGNGIIEPGEQCDCGYEVARLNFTPPGQTWECTSINGQACQAPGIRGSCRWCDNGEVRFIGCGNGVLEAANGEDCDCGMDPNNVPTAAQGTFSCGGKINDQMCNSNAYGEFCPWCDKCLVRNFGDEGGCGDGIVQTEHGEACDSTEGCGADCKPLTDWECDPENNVCTDCSAGSSGWVCPPAPCAGPTICGQVTEPACRKAGCQQTQNVSRQCQNAHNDGCCGPDPDFPGSNPVIMETINNDWGCPVRFGDFISLKAVEPSGLGHQHGDKFMTVNYEDGGAWRFDAWRPVDPEERSQCNMFSCCASILNCPADAEKFRFMNGNDLGSRADINKNTDQVAIQSMKEQSPDEANDDVNPKGGYLSRTAADCNWVTDPKVNLQDVASGATCGGSCPSTWEKFNFEAFPGFVRPYNQPEDSTLRLGDHVRIKPIDLTKYFDVDWGHDRNETSFCQGGSNSPTEFIICNQRGLCGSIGTPVCTSDTDPVCNDSNPCTNDGCMNIGTPQARCYHEQILVCGGATGDACCPSGCNSVSGDPSFDIDCTLDCSDLNSYTCDPIPECNPATIGCGNVNLTCSKFGCSSFDKTQQCTNRENDGCCQGENVDNEYSCPILASLDINASAGGYNGNIVSLKFIDDGGSDVNGEDNTGFAAVMVSEDKMVRFNRRNVGGSWEQFEIFKVDLDKCLDYDYEVDAAGNRVTNPGSNFSQWLGDGSCIALRSVGYRYPADGKGCFMRDEDSSNAYKADCSSSHVAGSGFDAERMAFKIHVVGTGVKRAHFTDPAGGEGIGPIIGRGTEITLEDVNSNGQANGWYIGNYEQDTSGESSFAACWGKNHCFRADSQNGPDRSDYRYHYLAFYGSTGDPCLTNCNDPACAGKPNPTDPTKLCCQTTSNCNTCETCSANNCWPMTGVDGNLCLGPCTYCQSGICERRPEDGSFGSTFECPANQFCINAVCGSIYCDEDNDSYYSSQVAVSCPSGRQTLIPPGQADIDCDDTNPNVHPGATEICGNGIDDDCVGGDAVCTGNYCDEDNDGRYNENSLPNCPSGRQITTPPVGDQRDCNDNNGNIYYGNTNTYCACIGLYPQGTTEICGNAVDEDCNGIDDPCGLIYCDKDSDGHYGLVSMSPSECVGLGQSGTRGDDCNDNNSLIHPGATEVCNDSTNTDEDCDTSVNCADPDCRGQNNSSNEVCCQGVVDCLGQRGNCAVTTCSANICNYSGSNALCAGGCAYCQVIGSGAEATYNCAPDPSYTCPGCSSCQGTGTNFSCQANNANCTDVCSQCIASGPSSFDCQPITNFEQDLSDPAQCHDNVGCAGGNCVCVGTNNCISAQDSDNDSLVDAQDPCPYDPGNDTDNDGICAVGCTNGSHIYGSKANGYLCDAGKQYLQYDTCLGGTNCDSSNSCLVLFGADDYLSIFIGDKFLTGNLYLPDGYKQVGEIIGGTGQGSDPAYTYPYPSGKGTKIYFNPVGFGLASGQNTIAFEALTNRVSGTSPYRQIRGVFADYAGTGLCTIFTLPNKTNSYQHAGAEASSLPYQCYVINDGDLVEPGADWYKNNLILNGYWETSLDGAARSSSAATSLWSVSGFNSPYPVWGRYKTQSGATFVTSSHAYCRKAFTY